MWGSTEAKGGHGRERWTVSPRSTASRSQEAGGSRLEAGTAWVEVLALSTLVAPVRDLTT